MKGQRGDSPTRRPYLRRGSVVTFDERQCAEPGCGTRYTPTGPNAKYCDDHSDARLRERGNWAQLRERARRRPSTSDRCECCGAPAEGSSHYGIVCCAKCREDAEVAAVELLEERRAADLLRARAS